MYQSVYPLAETDYDDFNSYPIDIAKHINQSGGEKKVLAEIKVSQYFDQLKTPLLIKRINELGEDMQNDKELAKLIITVSESSAKKGKQGFTDAVKLIK